MSLVSALRDIPLSDSLVAFGEVGLSGELRSVPRVQARVNEAARMGFTKCILPKACLKQITSVPDNIKLTGARTLSEAISVIRWPFYKMRKYISYRIYGRAGLQSAIAVLLIFTVCRALYNTHLKTPVFSACESADFNNIITNPRCFYSHRGSNLNCFFSVFELRQLG